MSLAASPGVQAQAMHVYNFNLSTEVWQPHAPLYQLVGEVNIPQISRLIRVTEIVVSALQVVFSQKLRILARLALYAPTDFIQGRVHRLAHHTLTAMPLLTKLRTARLSRIPCANRAYRVNTL